MENQREQQAEINYREAKQDALETREAAKNRAWEAWDAIQGPAGDDFNRAIAQGVLTETLEPAQEAYTAACKPAERAYYVACLEADGVYHAAMVETIAEYAVVLQAPQGGE